MRLRDGTALLFLATALPLAACQTDADVTPGSVSELKNDAQVVGVLAQIPIGDRTLSEFAAANAYYPQVRAMAEQFAADDRAALPAVINLTGIGPAGSATSDLLVRGFVNDNEQLAPAMGQFVDITYLCQQILGQIVVLQIYDTQLVLVATDPKVVLAVQAGRMLTVAHQTATIGIAQQLGLNFGTDEMGPFCGIGPIIGRPMF
jgi:hypothetical protein